MSERASRLAQMKHGPGYSRGQMITEKTESGMMKENARQRQRGRQHSGSMILASNQVRHRTTPTEDPLLHEGGPKGSQDSARGHLRRKNAAENQWSTAPQPHLELAGDGSIFSQTVDTPSVSDSRTESPDDVGMSADPNELHDRMQATKSQIKRLTNKEDELLGALKQIKLRKAEAQALLAEQQAAYALANTDGY